MKVLEQPEHAGKVIVKCTGAGNGNNGCGATLEADRDDLRWFKGHEGYFRIYNDAVVVRCPICQATTDIPKEDWPPLPEQLKKWTTAWREGLEKEGDK